MSDTVRNNSRIAWIDVARGTSILMVVFYHATIWSRELGGVPGWIELLNEALRPIRMPLFFVISGYLAQRLMFSGTFDTAKRRVANFFYIYLVWNIISFAVYTLLIPNMKDPELYASGSAFFLQFVMPVNELWFIWALGIFTSVAFTFRTKIPLVLALAMVISVTVFSKAFVPDNFAWVSTLVNAPFFFIGLLLSRDSLRVFEVRPAFIFVGSACAYITLAAGIYIMPAESGLLFGIGRFSISVIGLAVGISISVVLSRMWWFASPLQAMGGNTLQIYLVHSFLINAFVYFVLRYFGSFSSPIPNSLLMGAVAVPVSIVIGSMTYQRLPWLYDLKHSSLKLASRRS